MEMMIMPKNNHSMDSSEMDLENIADELFILIRTCYNQGNNDIKLIILDNCMKIVLDSLQKESDLKKLKDVFNNISGINED
jgi:hypothetical protein